MKTQAFHYALERSRSEKYITLCGVSGAGKSSMAYHIALQLEKDGYNILPVSSLKEVNRYFDFSESQVFILDDPLGRSSLDITMAEEVELISATIDEKFALGDSKIIFTCRQHVIDDQELKNSTSIVRQNIIDLHRFDLKLSRDEKQNIFEKHTNKLEIKFDANEILAGDQANFPLLCKMYSCNKSFQKEGKSFFTNAFSIVISNIKEFRDTKELEYFALLLCALCDGCFDTEAFSEGAYEIQEQLVYSLVGADTHILLTDIVESMNKLENIYLLKENTNFRFIHESLFEAVIYFLGKHYGEEVFRRCPLPFIQRYLIVVKSHGEQLTTKECDLLAYRHITEIKKGNFLDVFLNPYFEDDDILMSFIKKLDSLKSAELTEMMLNTKTRVNKQRIASVRRENIWNKMTALNILLESEDVKAFHWIIALNFTILFYYIFTRLDKFPGHENIGLECIQFVHAACFGGNTEIMDKLLKTGNAGSLKNQCKPLKNSALHMAVYSRNPDVAKKVIESSCVQLVSIQNIFECTALFDAAAMGLHNMCTLLIEKGSDVNKLSKGGLSPLWIAAEQGHSNIVKLLLSNKSDINYADEEGATPISIAAERGQEEVIKVLIENDAEINLCDKENISPLYIAAQNGFGNIVKLLLKNKANPNLQENNGESPLYIASRNGHKEVVRLLLENEGKVNLCDKDGVSPLNIACHNGHTETVRILLDHKAAITQLDRQHVSPLYIAAQSGHLKTVEVLLEYDISKALINLKDKSDVSPLYIASHNEHQDIVEVLLRHGANVDQQTDDRATPLYIAAYRGNTGTLKLLLDQKATVNVKDNNSVTAFYMAAQNGHTECLRMLIENGGDVNSTDNEGISPLFAAVQQNHCGAVALLLNNRGDCNLCDAEGVSPMTFAVNNNQESIVRMLKASK